jgi:hypothetical protein
VETQVSESAGSVLHVSFSEQKLEDPQNPMGYHGLSSFFPKFAIKIP